MYCLPAGELLLVNGSKPNAKNKEQWAPIHILAKHGSEIGISWILLMNNIVFPHMNRSEIFDINLTGGSSKWSALQLAGNSGHTRIVE